MAAWVHLIFVNPPLFPSQEGKRERGRGHFRLVLGWVSFFNPTSPEVNVGFHSSTQPT